MSHDTEPTAQSPWTPDKPVQESNRGRRPPSVAPDPRSTTSPSRLQKSTVSV